MKHILKVANISEVESISTRPLIAMDNNGDMTWHAVVQASDFIDLGLSVK